MSEAQKSDAVNTTGRLRAFTGSERRRRFGRYETLFRIAGGGMAEVYAARILGEGGFEKVVALKRMLPTLAEDERFVTMFLDEGRVSSNISSPNVVQTLDLGRAEDDSLYLVMELVVGVPLSKLLREVLRSGKHLPVPIAVEILAQAANGLHDAHEAVTPMGEHLRIVHRDISPQNILVDRAGRTRITDFGVARAMQRHSHTQTGEVKGKMAYFAPEQATGGQLDHRVDIFALGIVAWETFTGRRLFKSENPLHTLQKITVDPIPQVKDVRTEIPEAINDCIMKALSRDPAGRFQSSRAFADALRAASPEPADRNAVGLCVNEHGGDALERLQHGLKLALSGQDIDDDNQDEIATAVERTPLSTSAVLPTGASSATFRTKSVFLRPPAIGGILLAALAVGAGIALFSGGAEQTTASEAAAAPETEVPATATAPPAATAAPAPTVPEAAPAEAAAPSPPAAEATSDEEPRPARRAGRSWTRRNRDRSRTRAATPPSTPVVEPPPEQTPPAMTSTTAMTSAMTATTRPTAMTTMAPEPTPPPVQETMQETMRGGIRGDFGSL